MHIVIIVLGLLAAGSFWWYRLKDVGNAAGEVADQVGKMRGHFRRKGLRKKADLSPVTAIDDPVIAAATVIMAICAEDKVVSEALESRVRATIEPIAGSPDRLVEAVAYAKWASDQVEDVPTVIDNVSAFLALKLNQNEKEELIAMIDQSMSKEDRHPSYALRMERLRRKLGLVGQK